MKWFKKVEINWNTPFLIKQRGGLYWESTNKSEV